MKILQYTFILLITLKSCGQKAENTSSNANLEGVNIVDYKAFKYLKTNREFGKITSVKDVNNEITALRIETNVQPKHLHNLSTKIPLQNKGAKNGDVFLLTFTAKTEKSSLETGEAKVLWLLKQSNSYKNNIFSTQSLSSNWKTYYVPFKASKNISKKDLSINMQYGYKEQSFLIKDIKFETFRRGTKLFDLPKTKITYAGMESDAQWRKDANTRIEKIRKGNFTVSFSKNGVPVKEKKVQITLKKHHFKFGAAIDANDVVSNNMRYKNFKKGFDYVVLANDLKIKKWSNLKRRETTLQAIEILRKDDITIKGHVLIWPGFNYLTPKVRKNRNNPKRVENIINSHVKNVLKATAEQIYNWDVVNEAYTNKDLQKILGSEKILYNGFRIAKNKQPNAIRSTNEYGIISKGGLDTQKQEWYYNFIKRIDKATGGLVQGVGIQGHIGSDLTTPKKVLELLDYYGTLDKKIGISEFTMDIKDADIREQYTRDFMIAAFSHKNVSEFLFWGCTDDERKKVDIFTETGEIGVMGKAYFDLVNKEWKTNLSVKTNQKGGMLSTNGFYGTYEYSFTENGKEIKGDFVFEPNGKSDFEIKI